MLIWSISEGPVPRGAILTHPVVSGPGQIPKDGAALVRCGARPLRLGAGASKCGPIPGPGRTRWQDREGFPATAAIGKGACWWHPPHAACSASQILGSGVTACSPHRLSTGGLR
jgi:hypothetical protein